MDEIAFGMGGEIAIDTGNAALKRAQDTLYDLSNMVRTLSSIAPRNGSTASVLVFLA